MLHRYGPENERAAQQVHRELAVIEKLSLAGYFLIVWDIVRFCREKNILVQGRGLPQTAPSVIRWQLRLLILSEWIYFLSVFFPKNAANGRILTWICRAATSASAPFSTCMNATGNWVRQ